MNSTQQPTQEVFDYAYAQVAAGVPAFDVQRQLVANGWDTQTAAYVMNHVRHSLEMEAVRQDADRGSTGATEGGTMASAPGTALPPPLSGEGFQTGNSAAKQEKKGKIPFRAYRDLIVGGIIMLVALALHLTGAHSIYGVLTLGFGVIQVVRGIVVAGLSQYQV